MSSGRGTGKGPVAGAGIALQKGKGIESSCLARNGLNVDQMTHDVAGITIDSLEGDDWEVIGKKSKNRGGSNSAKSWASSANATKSWGHPEPAPKRGMSADIGKGKLSGNSGVHSVEPKRQLGNSKPQTPNKAWEAAYMAPPPVVPPPLQHGWQWGSRNCRQSTAYEEKLRNENASEFEPPEGTLARQLSGTDISNQLVDSDDNEVVEDTDDDLSEDDDSDASPKSFETRKRSSMLQVFFEQLDKLSIEQINEPTRQWHCPACQNGPGAIDWYKGLQPLMTHAKTKGSKRVKLHREFAELLDEELQRRGTSVIPSGEAFGKWKGLRETTDRQIVWPPMTVIMNTRLDKDDNDKWIGMGNQELLNYFSTYAAVKSRHSYGPQGHRGMSVLVFEASAVGYMEAERLHKHFVQQGTDRAAWENTHRRVLFSAGGKRQLYGFLAQKEDMEVFNQHSAGKSRLKYEMRSYQEMVVSQMKQMSEDNQQLTYFKNKFAKQQQRSKTLEESFGLVSQKLRETVEENRIVRLRTKTQHEENKEEMDFQENFFKEQMAKVHKALEEKEMIFEKLKQEERLKAKQGDVYSRGRDDRRLRDEEISRFIATQVKEVEEFEAEREKLIHAHEEKKVEMKRRHLDEEVELEKEFENGLTKLMEKYTPGAFKASSGSCSSKGSIEKDGAM